MTTPIQTIQQQLLSYSTQTTLTNFNQLVASLTPTQVQQVGAPTLDHALNNLSLNHGATPASVASSLSAYMIKVGSFLDGNAISTAVENLARTDNLTGVTAIIDHLVPGQANSLGGPDLDNALVLISQQPSQTGVAGTLTDFMTRVGSVVSGFAISTAIDSLAQSNNLAGVKAIIDHLVPGQANGLGSPQLDDALVRLSTDPAPTTQAQAALAATITDFMNQVGPVVSSFAVGTAIDNLAIANNQGGIKAIIDHLVPGQANSLGSPQLDDALVRLSQEPTPTTQTQAGVAATISDFMTQVGSVVSGFAIGTAIDNLAQTNNQGGVKAIVDHLVPGQANGLGSPQLDDALVRLSTEPTPTTATQNALTATIADFMTHVGSVVSSFAIGTAIDNLAQVNDQTAVKAIVDNLVPGQANGLGSPQLDDALVRLSSEPAPTTATQTTLANTIADFMSHVGSVVSGFAVSTAIDTLAQTNNQAGVKAIIDHLVPGQANGLGSPQLDDAMIRLSGEPAPTTQAQNALAATLTDFMNKVGSAVNPFAIAGAIHNLIGSNNVTDIQAIAGHVSAGQKAAVIADLTPADNAYLAAHHIAVV